MCGSSGSTDFRHTWSDGIRSCQARRSRVVMGQQMHASSTQSDSSSDDASAGGHPGEVTVADNIFASATTNSSTPTPLTQVATPSIVAAHTSILRTAREPMTYNHSTTTPKATNSTTISIIRTPMGRTSSRPNIFRASGVSMSLVALTHASDTESIAVRAYDDKLMGIIAYCSIILGLIS